MSKTESPVAPTEAAGPQKPVWQPPKNELEVYKDQQRAWRQSEEDKRYADLAAGQKQYQVAIVAANGHQDIIQGPRETKVSSLTVGGSSPDEAIGKFCRFAGITGGMENVKIVG